ASGVHRRIRADLPRAVQKHRPIQDPHLAVTLEKTGRRKILLLAPRWPYPVLGGDKLRIWQLARAVAQQHDGTLLSLCGNEAEMTDAISMAMARAASANAVRDARRAIYGLEARRLKAYEVDTQHHFDLISLVSEVDRNVLFGPGQAGRARTLVIPNGFGPASTA